MIFNKSPYASDPCLNNSEPIGPVEVMGNAAAAKLLGISLKIKPISHTGAWLNPSAFGFDYAVDAVPMGGKRAVQVLPPNAPPWLPHNPPGS